MIDYLDTLALKFQALADPTRIRILQLIRSGSPSATDLNQALGMSQPRVAHHIKILVTSGLVLAGRDGRFVRYKPPLAGVEREIFDLALSHLPVEIQAARKPAPDLRSREPADSSLEQEERIDPDEPDRGGDLEDFLL